MARSIKPDPQSAPVESLVLTVCEDGVAVVTLNRPERLNALSAGLMSEALSALEAVAADPKVRAVVLTGAGEGFCAGADLFDLEAGQGDVAGAVAWAMQAHFNPLVRAVAEFPKPTVAAVNGVCAGGGAGLALACDMAICGAAASFRFPFLPRLGLIPDMGAPWLLARRVGVPVMRELCLVDEPVDAARAAQLNLVRAVCADAELMARARGLAEQLGRIDSSAFATFRSLCDGLAGRSFAAELALEAGLQPALAAGAAFQGALKNFRARRVSKESTVR